MVVGKGKAIHFFLGFHMFLLAIMSYLTLHKLCENLLTSTYSHRTCVKIYTHLPYKIEVWSFISS